MKPTVYVETTIPSYLTGWPSRDVVRAGEQQVTRDWWERRSDFDLRISSLELLECSAGDTDAAALRLAALDGVLVLAQTLEAENLAEALLREVPFVSESGRRRAAYCDLRCQWHGISIDVELYAYRQCNSASEDRGSLSADGLRAASDLYADGTSWLGRKIMSDVDILAQLRAWRDEFARSHGYDIHAMAAALRDLDGGGKHLVVHGEPRRPVMTKTANQSLEPPGAAIPVSQVSTAPEAAPASEPITSGRSE